MTLKDLVSGPLFESGGAGGGGGERGMGDVTALPEVPGPAEDDLDLLSEGDEGTGDESPAGDGESEGETPRRESQIPPEPGTGDGAEEEEEFDVEEEPEEEPPQETPPEGETKQTGPFKAISQKYPNFFKDFPEMRRTIGEHQRYRSIFSTTEEAAEAASSAQDFADLSEQIFNGNFEVLIDNMETEQRGSFKNLANRIFPAIKKFDQNLYVDVTTPAISEFLDAAYNRARASGNKNLMNSAQYAWQFLTGKFEPPQAPGAQADPRDKEFNERVEKFNNTQMQSAQTNVNSQIAQQVAFQIANAIDPINPGTKKRRLPDVTRNALVNHVMGQIDGELTKDEIHMQKIRRLWTQARRSAYSQGHLSRIVSAYLERAKSGLPKLVNQIRKENGLEQSMRKEGRGESRTTYREEQTQRRPDVPRLPGGRASNPKSLREINPRKIDYNRTSDEDLLAGRARLKR